ncbi:polyketide synthase [Colletotrichum tofieldiae]|nr:polyketide synthase [Colletotrichum tofieldiae]GKT97740.1 polyketide synthase [Colletotrichum tofieldiae]
MLARPAENIERATSITLLTQSDALDAFGQRVMDLLIQDGFIVEQRAWGRKLPKGQDVISLIDLERSKPLLQDVTSEDLTYFVQTIRDTSDAAVLWAMPPAQTNCRNPYYGQMLGAARSIRAELGVDLITIELETTANQTEAASVFKQVFRKIQRARTAEDNSELDTEYIWAAGNVHVGRFHRAQTKDSLAAIIFPNGESTIDSQEHRFAGMNSPQIDVSRRAPSLKPDFSYLLVGDLENLGRATVSWMISAGARDFIVCSPSAGKSDADQAFMQQVKKSGCMLRCFAGEVADRNFVQGVITQAQRPIAGVVMHVATIHRNESFLSMSHASWTSDIQPKVQGTWNLHHLLPKDLDFFVLASLDGGLQGHSSNASANAFHDAFSSYRKVLGLPASVIHTCDIEEFDFAKSQDSGLASQTADHVDTLRSEPDFLRGLQLAITRSADPQHIVPPVVTNLSHGHRRSDQIVLSNISHLKDGPRGRTIWKLGTRTRPSITTANTSMTPPVSKMRVETRGEQMCA